MLQTRYVGCINDFVDSNAAETPSKFVSSQKKAETQFQFHHWNDPPLPPPPKKKKIK